MHIDTKNDPITETQFKIENPPIICHVKIRQYRPNVDWSIGNLEQINGFKLMSGKAYYLSLSRSFYWNSVSMVVYIALYGSIHPSGPMPFDDKTVEMVIDDNKTTEQAKPINAAAIRFVNQSLDFSASTNIGVEFSVES